MSSLRILEVRPDDSPLIEQIATITHKEFHHLRPSETLSERIEKFRQRVSRHADSSSVVFAALQEDLLVGTISIVEKDLDTKTLQPWLASLWVAPSHRHQGIATTLLHHCEAFLCNHHIYRIYLFTDSIPAFYQKLGWNTLEKEEFNGHQITIFYKDLHYRDAHN